MKLKKDLDPIRNCRFLRIETRWRRIVSSIWKFIDSKTTLSDYLERQEIKASKNLKWKNLSKMENYEKGK
jgi:hypothetical protein